MDNKNQINELRKLRDLMNETNSIYEKKILDLETERNLLLSSLNKIRVELKKERRKNDKIVDENKNLKNKLGLKTKTNQMNQSLQSANLENNFNSNNKTILSKFNISNNFSPKKMMVTSANDINNKSLSNRYNTENKVIPNLKIKNLITKNKEKLKLNDKYFETVDSHKYQSENKFSKSIDNVYIQNTHKIKVGYKIKNDLKIKTNKKIDFENVKNKKDIYSIKPSSRAIKIIEDNVNNEKKVNKETTYLKIERTMEISIFETNEDNLECHVIPFSKSNNECLFDIIQYLDEELIEIDEDIRSNNKIKELNDQLSFYLNNHDYTHQFNVSEIKQTVKINENQNVTVNALNQEHSKEFNYENENIKFI